MSKQKLNYCDRSDRVQSMTKTKKNNGVTIHVGMAYDENQTGQ